MGQSEFQIIEECFNTEALTFSRSEIIEGIGNDAAVLRLPDNELSLSMDLLVADIHFPANASPEKIATRAFAVNLSDMAAMAAQPLCFTLGLSLPDASADWLIRFGRGLAQLAKKFNCPLVGGDLTQSPTGSPITIAIQVHGTHSKNAPLKRSSAKVGDSIYVSGTLGNPTLALASMGIENHLSIKSSDFVTEFTRADQNTLDSAYFSPQPRVGLALALAPLIHGAIDISDGLAGDLEHILDASKVGAQLKIDELPYSPIVQKLLPQSVQQQVALFGGDDYELCFTAAPQAHEQIMDLANGLGVPVTRIGGITQQPGLRLLDADNAEVEVAGSAYNHFLESET